MSCHDRSDARRRTAAARAALARKFPDSDAKSAFYRSLGEQAAKRRVILSGEEAQALREAYALLTRIAARHPQIAATDAEEGIAA